MIRIAICDDESWYRETLRGFCETYFAENGYHNLLAEYASGEELLEAMAKVKQNGEPFADLLLLDIEMPGIDGIRLKDLMQREHKSVRILFVTSHSEAMPEAFGSRVFGFLQKPVKYEEFQRKMGPVLADIREEERYEIVEHMFETRKIYRKQIRYIQGEGKYTQLYLEGEADALFSDRSLGSWKERLEEDGFFLCHKCYLVNFYHVKSIGEEILLKGGGRVPVSRRMRKECMEQYRKYLWEKAEET